MFFFYLGLPTTPNATTAAAARTNLGLGDMATKTASDYLTKTTNVSEMGRYIDMHYDNATSAYDYDVRLQVNSQGTVKGGGVLQILGANVKATKFEGPLTGNVTGNCSGSSGSCTGNAATATKATNDSDNKPINTTYAKLAGNNSLSGNNTLSGANTFSGINTFSNKVILAKTTDASGTAAGNCALQIGDTAGTHLEFDGNEIMAKSNVSTPSTLWINSDGSLTTFGDGGVSVKGGGVTIVGGGLTASNQTIKADTFDGSLQHTVKAVTTTGGSYYDAVKVQMNRYDSNNDNSIYDYGFIRFGNSQTSKTGDDKGYLELATGDDGDEPIYVRQYDYEASTPGAHVRQAILLDSIGNTSFPGTVTAAGFKGNFSTKTTFTDNVTIQGKASVDNLLYVGSDSAPNEIVLGTGGGIGRLWLENSFSRLKLLQKGNGSNIGYDVLVNGGQKLILGSGETVSKIYNSTIPGYNYTSTRSDSLEGGVGEGIYLLTDTHFEIRTKLKSTSTTQVFTFDEKLTAPTVVGALEGNAQTASSLQTARALQVSLNKTSSTDFQGDAAVTNIGVQGTLQPAQGGTGQTVLSAVTVGSANKDGAGNVISNTYAKLNGGANFTGDITMGTSKTPTNIKLFNQGMIGRTYGSSGDYDGLKIDVSNSKASLGSNVILRGGQNLLLTAGEGINSIYGSSIAGSDSIPADASGESIYLIADSSVKIMTNTNANAENRKIFSFDTTGNLTATKFTGNLVGNVTGSVTKTTTGYSTINTAATETVKSATISNLDIKVGTIVTLSNTKAGTSDDSTEINLSINDVSKKVYISKSTPMKNSQWVIGYYLFVYHGSYWICLSYPG